MSQELSLTPLRRIRRVQKDQQSPKTGPPVSFVDLPLELHLIITQQLTYPDALSLKRTCRYFSAIVDTGVKLKVAWLIERKELHLECPNDRSCCFGSDLQFCRGSVRLLMQRRREHFECDMRPGLGCLVLGTSRCEYKRTFKQQCERWLHLRPPSEIWWLLLAMVPVVLGCLWAAELADWTTRGTT